VTSDADKPEGVFGNLPSTRPGSRSPRRHETDAVREPAPEPEAKPEEAPLEPEAGSDPSTPSAADIPSAGERSDLTDAEGPLAPQPSIHGVEDLAWAGVAVVAQAATAGIRFTSKALEAARKSIDRP
jgi:hypothetical protein